MDRNFPPKADLSLAGKVRYEYVVFIGAEPLFGDTQTGIAA